MLRMLHEAFLWGLVVVVPVGIWVIHPLFGMMAIVVMGLCVEWVYMRNDKPPSGGI